MNTARQMARLLLALAASLLVLGCRSGQVKSGSSPAPMASVAAATNAQDGRVVPASYQGPQTTAPAPTQASRWQATSALEKSEREDGLSDSGWHEPEHHGYGD